MNKFNNIISFIREIFKTEDYVPLNRPLFNGREKEYLAQCIDSSFVSSFGEFVKDFEEKVKNYTQAKYAIAINNGTSALHLALVAIGADKDSEIIISPITFIASVNAISYTCASPLFIGCDNDNLAISPNKINEFIKNNTYKDKNGYTRNKDTNKIIKAIVAVHIFGHPAKLYELREIANENNIILIEDAAQSFGSFYDNIHTGTIGDIGIFSFNGNKIITTGGGGMVVTNDESLHNKMLHLATTAKTNHPYEYYHDMIGFNYKMPSLNAALGIAQIEKIDEMLKKKRWLSKQYKDFFNNIDIEFITEPEKTKSNYWQNAILLKNKEERNSFIEYSESKGIMTRPLWNRIDSMDIYKSFQSYKTDDFDYILDRIVNIPSSCV